MTGTRLLVFCILSVIGTYASATAGSEATIAKTDVPSEVYRLPQTVFPEYYKLNVLTHIDDEEGFRFFGNVSILVSFNLQRIRLFLVCFSFSRESFDVHDIVITKTVPDINTK